MTIAEKIKKLRKERKLTQIQLASKVGIGVASIQRYERNELQPNIETLKKIADALDTALVNIIGMDKLLHIENRNDIDNKIIGELNDKPQENSFYSPSELEQKNKEGILNSIKEISKLSEMKIKEIYTEGVLVDWEVTEEGEFPIYDGAGLFNGIEVTYKNKSFTLTAEEYHKLANKIIESVATNILAAKADKE